MPLKKSLLLLLVAGIFCVACHRLPTGDISGIFPGSPLVDLQSPQLLVLGPLEGPWRLDKVVSPTCVSLVKDKAAQQFTLLGLISDEYPDPDAAAKGGAALDPEEQRRLADIQSYKIQALTTLLHNVPIWTIRASDDHPPLTHLFVPENLTAATQPGARGWLVSARALRDGIAVMDLDGPDYALRDTMLDCQFAAIAESLQQTADRAQSSNIWSRFDLRLPPPRWDARLDFMEQKLGLNKPKATLTPR